MSAKPKSCPFCGSDKLLSSSVGLGAGMAEHCVTCISCQSEGPKISGYIIDITDTDLEAIKLWNKREQVSITADQEIFNLALSSAELKLSDIVDRDGYPPSATALLRMGIRSALEAVAASMKASNQPQPTGTRPTGSTSVPHPVGTNR